MFTRERIFTDHNSRKDSTQMKQQRSQSYFRQKKSNNIPKSTQNQTPYSNNIIYSQHGSFSQNNKFVIGSQTNTPKGGVLKALKVNKNLNNQSKQNNFWNIYNPDNQKSQNQKQQQGNSFYNSIIGTNKFSNSQNQEKTSNKEFSISQQNLNNNKNYLYTEGDQDIDHKLLNRPNNLINNNMNSNNNNHFARKKHSSVHQQPKKFLQRQRDRSVDIPSVGGNFAINNNGPSPFQQLTSNNRKRSLLSINQHDINYRKQSNQNQSSQKEALNISQYNNSNQKKQMVLNNNYCNPNETKYNFAKQNKSKNIYINNFNSSSNPSNNNNTKTQYNSTTNRGFYKAGNNGNPNKSIYNNNNNDNNKVHQKQTRISSPYTKLQKKNTSDLNYNNLFNHSQSQVSQNSQQSVKNEQYNNNNNNSVNRNSQMSYQSQNSVHSNNLNVRNKNNLQQSPYYQALNTQAQRAQSMHKPNNNINNKAPIQRENSVSYSNNNQPNQILVQPNQLAFSKGRNIKQQNNNSQQSQQNMEKFEKTQKEMIQKKQREEIEKLEKQAQKDKNIHPKDKYDMSDDEWKQFGDRFPKNFQKLKLLGRGGFALVWLGQNTKTKEVFALKQILTNNHHQTHIKEIWFGRQFYEKGVCKPKFVNYRGTQNLSRMMDYEIKSQDTWIFYEVCGPSLGNSLYDLKGEGVIGEERVYKIHYHPLYQSFKKDIKQLKRLTYEIAHSILLLADNNIVHSDVKTENILIRSSKNNQTGLYQITEAKLIDYGSSFTFGNLKHFSMATPEYMAPEILNYILYQNNMNYFHEILPYLQNYTKTYVIDIWSLGCVILEMVSGLPLWMSLKTIVNYKNKDLIKKGLFAAKGRVFEDIIKKQIEVAKNLDEYLDHHNYSGINVDQELRMILKGMLDINPQKRMEPVKIVNILGKSLGLPLHNLSAVNEENNNINNGNSMKIKSNSTTDVIQDKKQTSVTQSTEENLNNVQMAH